MINMINTYSVFLYEDRWWQIFKMIDAIIQQQVQKPYGAACPLSQIWAWLSRPDDTCETLKYTILGWLNHVTICQNWQNYVNARDKKCNQIICFLISQQSRWGNGEPGKLHLSNSITQKSLSKLSKFNTSFTFGSRTHIFFVISG